MLISIFMMKWLLFLSKPMLCSSSVANKHIFNIIFDMVKEVADEKRYVYIVQNGSQETFLSKQINSFCFLNIFGHAVYSLYLTKN
jgi:hypothetical protein